MIEPSGSAEIREAPVSGQAVYKVTWNNHNRENKAGTRLLIVTGIRT